MSFAIGQRAAIYQEHITGGMSWEVTIERDTKLYWVADGRRFRKSDGLEPGSNSGWDRGRFLLPLDDSRVIAAAKASSRAHAYNLVLNAQHELNLDRESIHAVDRLKQALHAYAELLP